MFSEIHAWKNKPKVRGFGLHGIMSVHIFRDNLHILTQGGDCGLPENIANLDDGY